MSGKVQIFGGGAGFEPGIVTTFPANTVPYINGSQATAYDATFTYQSSQLGVGISSSLGAKLHVKGANDSSGSALKVQTATYEVINTYNSRNVNIGGGSVSAGTDYKITAFGSGSVNTDKTLTISDVSGDNIVHFYNTPGWTNGGLAILRSSFSASRNAIYIGTASTVGLSITSSGIIVFNSGINTTWADTDGNYIQPTTSATHGAGVQGMLYNTLGGGSTASHIFRKGRGSAAINTGPIVLLYSSYLDSGVTGTADTQFFQIKPTINLTGSGVKNIIGYYYTPTMTSLTGGGRNFAMVAETGNVLIGAAVASGNASAALQVVSTTQGFLPPVMTGAQAEAISTPAAGLLVYANNGNGVTITSTGWWGYTGSTWNKLN